MSIKIDGPLKQNIEDFRDWIKNASPEWLNENQEAVMTTLSLLLNSQFRTRIGHLRSVYKIPKAFFGESLVSFEEWERWEKKNYKTAPTNIYSKEILNLCAEFGLSPPNRYAFFVYHYLFFNQIFPSETDLGHGSVYSKKEYRYRARLETNAYKTFPQPNVTIREGYIRFFKDTTPNQLINFIKENWRQLKMIQGSLPLYPHPKKYSRFKRDILVYIHHLLGLTAPEIANAIATIDEESEEGYDLNDVEVRQIISYIDKKMTKTS
jgi:hypothetical protein